MRERMSAVYVCVISADKNITQASPRRSFDDGDMSVDGKLSCGDIRLFK